MVKRRKRFALCWASTDGSILAVGYIDGDILLWNILSASTRKDGAKAAPVDVVKLQLSSAEKRLPVIVLHWRATGNVAHDHGGQLFVYGGDEIGSEEILTDPLPGILSSIMKGFKSGLTVNSKGFSRSTFSEELEVMFSKNPFPDPSKSVAYEQEDVELSIDDIEIDDIVPLSSSSTAPSTSGLVHGRKKRDEENERDKLFGGREVTIKPRMRTPEEIIAQYRKSGDVTGAAENARNKLAERQEKLERTALRSEELRAGAENFKSMADELVKTLERRKWWQI